MEPEGVVDALRRIHRSLVPGGVLLDMRPGPFDSEVVAGGEAVGRLDESEFARETGAVDAALLRVVRDGLFALEDEVYFDVVHRFETAALLLADVRGWRSTRVPVEVAAGVERGRPPFEVHERCFLLRFRSRAPLHW